MVSATSAQASDGNEKTINGLVQSGHSTITSDFLKNQESGVMTCHKR